MSTYKQLTYEQRCQIVGLNKSGMRRQEVAYAARTTQMRYREISGMTMADMIIAIARHNDWPISAGIVQPIWSRTIPIAGIVPLPNIARIGY
jgi:hypothetical protein